MFYLDMYVSERNFMSFFLYDISSRLRAYFVSYLIKVKNNMRASTKNIFPVFLKTIDLSGKTREHCSIVRPS